MRTAILLLASVSVFAQAPSREISRKAGPQDEFLKAHPGSVALDPGPGRLIFHNPDGTNTAVLGALTHRDMNTGKWVANQTVLSTTADGWRVDGTEHSLTIGRTPTGGHRISQVYRDYETKKASVLTLSLPALVHDKDFEFHFVQDGLTWALEINGSGTYGFQTTVKARRGAATYRFAVGGSDLLTVATSGDLIGSDHARLSRAVMIPKVGKPVPCSAWTNPRGGVASFTCDDSSLRDDQLPYRIDPVTNTYNDYNGPYSISSETDWHGDCGDDTYTCKEHNDTNATVNFSSVLPANATLQSSSCSFSASSQTLASYTDPDSQTTYTDTITCSATTPDGSGNSSVTVKINDIAAANGPYDYTFNDSASISNVSLSVTYTEAPGLPSNLSFSGYSLSWINFSYSVSNYTGYQGINNYATANFIVNTSPTTPSGLYSVQNSSTSYSGCASGCSGSVTYTFQLNFTSAGSFHLYLNYSNSDQSTGWTNVGNVTISTPTASAPCFSPSAGSYTGPQSVTIGCANGGATIRYTTDGSTPSETSGTLYGGAISLGGTTTLKAIAYLSGYNDSSVTSGTYTLTLAAPTFSPTAGTYASTQSVTLSDSTSGASIYYTTNGDTPGTGSTVYTGAISVAASETVKAIAVKTNWTNSSVASAAYTITGTVANPTFSAASGTYQQAQSITLSTTTAGATIRYTTDGSTPSETAGTVYSSAITVPLNSSMTIKAIAYKNAWIDSAVTSASYTVTGTVVTPTFGLGTGIYTQNVTVSLTTGTSGATIRYTTNNQDPSDSVGTIYTSPINISVFTNLRVIAYKANWTPSQIANAQYFFAAPAGGTGTSGPGLGTPPSDSGNGLDPRRTGVRALGSYWGAAGEQIDTTSGNMNFSLPMLKAVSRGNWNVGASLSYNSQMWRQDSAGTWLMGYDVGYGLGWNLQLGSILPVWSNTSTVDHYLFIDSSGAEYSLSVNNSGSWTTIEGIHVWFDTGNGILHFPDGRFWIMGCTSSGDEQDAGTMYPTQVEDSNGNYIRINYMTGIGATGTNTSARITDISDPRTLNTAYTFTYTTDSIPHLTSIANIVGTPEAYSFNYLTNQTLAPPLGSATFPAITLLQSVTVSGLNISNTFTYATSGEMTGFTTPFGGTLGWTYKTFTYSGGVAIREVDTRSASWVSGSTNTWSFRHPSSEDTTPPGLHAWVSINDNGAQSTKFYWSAVISSNNLVAPTAYEEWNPDSTVNLHKDFAWTSDGTGNAYTGQVTTTMNPGTSYAVTSKSAQTMDIYGNLTQSQLFDYGNLTTAARTYNVTYAYQSDSTYLSKYIFNRPTLTTVTTTGGTTTLSGASYDQSTLQDPGAGSYLRQHDTAFDTNYRYRGNPTSTWQAGSSMTYLYQITGVPYQMTNGSGVTVTTAPAGDTNWSLPNVLTPNGNSNLSTSVSYATSFAVTSVTGPNGATGNTTYDSYGRPTSTTSLDGAVTNYTYTYLPNTQKAAITTGSNTEWKRTTLDGFGRTIKVETGHDGTTMAVTDTQYAPCACSPLGKLWRTSVPYPDGNPPSSNPSNKVGWTTNTYDGSGRTLTTVKPDGASTTSYVYQGNTTQVTDPAGKLKLFTNDAIGNLVTVTEPDPNNQPSGTMATSYTYNAMNQLIGVSMPRNLAAGGSYTQTRSFAWTGADLVSSTNPENGTVIYQYDGAHHVTKRTDAKSQETHYTYDSYGRLSQVQHYAWFTHYGLSGPYQQLDELPAQDVNYYYDSNPIAYNFSQNTWGRLAAVTFAPGSANTDSGGTIAMPGSAFYTWNYQTGNGQPSNLSISLNNNTSGATTWSAAIAGGSWLYLNSSSNTTASGSFNTNGIGTFSIVPANLSGLDTGTYTGTIVVQDSAGNQCVITVTLNVNVPSPTYAYAYHYSYNTAGRVTKQRLHVPNPEWDFDASYAWDNQGRMTSQTYPGGNNNFSYQYDSMGNLSAITNVVSATYNFAGQLSTLSWGGGIQETRSYDSQLRLTSIVTGGYQNAMLNETYVHSTTADNGRITSTVNGISGETVTYTYDAINRLASATSSNGSWTQAYSYDGFGNLTGMNGSAVGTFDPATNHTGSTDANGNPTSATFDNENRMTVSGSYTYTYDGAGKRVGQTVTAQDGPRQSTVWFYGIGGQRLQAFSCTTDSGSGNPSCTVQTTNVYFGQKLISTNSTNIATDRLGSVRASGSTRMSYYPYGEERPQSNGQTTTDGTEKFATYFRDGTGQDYADQRYYNQAGRFFSPDPGGLKTARLRNPGSWNRYAYVGGDPLNFLDRHGRERCDPDDLACEPDPCEGSPLITCVEGEPTESGGETVTSDGTGPRYPTPKVYNNVGTAAQKQALTNGFDDAFDHLNTVKCADFFTGTDHAATEFNPYDVLNALSDTTYWLYPSSMVPQTGAQTVDATNVQLNLNGQFFNYTTNANGTVTVALPDSAGNRTNTTFTDASTFQGFILLHEFGHQMGVYGPDTDSAMNGTNSAGVLDNCFNKDANGVYH
jgi:RHS repeat-associated protein